MMIKTALLIPGTEAGKYPSDNDDRDTVKASLGDVGTLQPLIVTACSGQLQGHYQVLDGLGRLAAAQDDEHPIPELPCLVVECDDPSNLAMHINSMGRKRTTGSRVLCYLLANKERVMEVYNMTLMPRQSYDRRGGAVSHMTGGGGAVSHMTGGSRRNAGAVPESLQPWTVSGISKRLGVSDKDVMLALELMICHDDNTYPVRATYGKYEPGTHITEDADINAMEKAFSGVICGRTPVRRWAAAFAGRVNTAGQGKAPTDYAKLGERTAVSLLNLFQNWATVEWQNREQREKVERDLSAALAMMPECCKVALIDLIPQSWSPHDKQALAKALNPKK